jgi:acyl-CoA synthetase (NDP forming)
MGSLTADWIEYLGLTVPPLSEMVKRKLKKLDTTPPYAILLNPADVRGSSVRGETTHDTLRVFLEAPEFDLVVMLFARSMITEESTKTAEAVVKAAKNGDKPLMIVWSGQNRTHKNSKSTNALDIFKEAGIPVFTQPSSLLKALSKLQAYWRYRQIWLNGFKGEQNHA